MATSSNIKNSSEGLFVLYTSGVPTYVASLASQGRLLILIEKLNEHKPAFFSSEGKNCVWR